MKLMLWLLALSGYIIAAQSHLQTIVANPGGIGGIYKGPDSETIVKGPDGSVITSQEKGGLIATEQKFEPIVAAEPAILEVAQPIGSEYIEDGHVIPLSHGEAVIGAGGPSLIEDGYIGPILQSNPVSPTLVAPPEPFIPATLPPPVHSVTPIITSRHLDIQGNIAPSLHLVAPPPHREVPHLQPIAPVLQPTSIPLGPVVPPVQSVVPVAVAPVVGHKVDIIEPDPHIIETEIVDAPAIEPKESTDLVGPSGSISTRGSESIVSGPASTTITKTAKVLVAPPVVKSIAAPIIAPVHSPPLVEINNELPLTSNIPVISPSAGPILSSTICPSARPIISSTVSPISVSTIGPSVIGPIVSTLAPPVVKYEGSHIVAPKPYHVIPESRSPYPAFATGLLTGEEFEGIGPSGVPHIPIYSSTVAPQVAHSSGPVLIQTATPRIVVEDEGASGFIQPGLGYSGVHSSTLIPITSTAAPPSYHQQHIHGQISGHIPIQNIIRPEVHSSNLVPVSSTIAPPSYDQQNIHGHIGGHISTQNIIPPEIGLRRKVINLDAPEISAPKAPGLVQPPLQGIDNDNIQRVDEEPAILEHNIQNGYYQNEFIVGNNANAYSPDRQLLSNTHPIQSSHQGPIGVPIPIDAAGLSARADGEHDYEDRARASLWNRYGRKTRNRKY